MLRQLIISVCAQIYLIKLVEIFFSNSDSEDNSGSPDSVILPPKLSPRV